MVFKVFPACGAEGGGTLGPSGPKAQVVLKSFSACGAEGVLVHFGASRPQSAGLVVFNIFSACGAEGMPFGAFRPPVVFKIFSACGAEGVNFGAFRPQSTCDVQDFLRLRRWRALWGLQTPMHRWCSKFSPPAALNVRVHFMAFQPESAGGVHNSLRCGASFPIKVLSTCGARNVETFSSSCCA